MKTTDVTDATHYSEKTIFKIASILFFPSIYAYVLGYRAQGIRATWKLGYVDAIPLEKVTPEQYQRTRIIPITVGIVIGILILAALYASGAIN